MLATARKKLRLEEQLADARLKYTEASPRVAVLREQVASLNQQVVTPQAIFLAISENLEKLQHQQASLQSDFLDKQMKYTPDATQYKNARQRLDDISERIQALQQQKRFADRQSRSTERQSR